MNPVLCQQVLPASSTREGRDRKGAHRILFVRIEPVVKGVGVK